MAEWLKGIRAILFDWDGTLLDSYRADVAAYAGMFRALGISWGEERLRRSYTPDWYRIFRAAQIPRSEWKRANRLWRWHYAKQTAELLPGAETVIGRLRGGYKLGLVTSGSRSRVLKQLRSFGMTRSFSARVYNESVTRRKPHPAPLQYALSQMRIRSNEAVYVGDTPEDIEMARRAGVCAIAVHGAFQSPRKLREARPFAILKSVEYLPDLLRLGHGSI